MRQAHFYFSIILFSIFGFCNAGFAKNIYFEEIRKDQFFESEISSTIANLNCTFTLSANIVQANCENGGGIGEIDLTVSGGTAPITYSWSNGSTTQDLTGLDAGVYGVTVEDGTGCQTVEYYQVSSGAGQTEFDYFIPMSEADIHSNFYNFTAVWIPYFYLSNSIRTIISIAATDENTIITYDHWEDGQESDISNPSQSTTQIWGDGNISNGIPPGYSVDILNAGDVIELNNIVSLPRNASSLKFDGRDHIASSEQLAVSRAGWGPFPGPVLSGAVEILEKKAYGTEYQVPIGENIASDEMFEYVGLSVMAADNFTLVQIDTDGNGSNDVTQVLNMGETYFHNGGIESGATISASKPIQAHLLTGDVYALFEARWFTLFPRDLWDDSYYNPIGSTVATDPSNVFVYNPNGSSLTVSVETQLGTTNFSVPSKGVYRYEMPMNSGAHFYTNNKKDFFALCTVDSDAQRNNDAHDWGFTLMPESYLTTSATIGYGPGNNGLTGNGSPAWVTSTQPTTLYVDYDGDPATGSLTDPKGNKYNTSYNIDAFESRRVFDPNDNDQTGMYLYTLDGTLIAVAWGQDPATADPGNPYLDFGTAVPPIRKITGWKDYVLAIDNDSDGKVDPGDVIEFSLYLENAGNSPVYGITITDELPDEITYIGATTTLNSSIVPDDGSGTQFPVDELGFYISTIPVNETYVITYQTTANAMPPVYSEIINKFTAFITDPCQTIEGEIIVPVETPPATSACDLFLANVGGGQVESFQINSDVCFQLTDSDQNNNTGAPETVVVTLENATTNDTETVTLTETGNSTGVFTGCISSSTTLGISDEDGIFYATEGSLISSSFTDGTNGDMCSDNAIFEAESFIKQLYLTETNGLDRVDPVSTLDASTSVMPLLNDVELVQNGGFELGSNTIYQNTNNWDNFYPEQATTARNLNSAYAGDYRGIVNNASVDPRIPFQDLNYSIQLGDVFDLSLYHAGALDWDLNTDQFAAVLYCYDGSIRIDLDSVFITPVAHFLTGYELFTYSFDGISNATAIGKDLHIRFESKADIGEGATFDEVSLKVNNVGVFIQTTPMCSDLDMPAGGMITVENYINDLNGNLPSNPDVAAVLKKNGVPFSTLTNPTFASGKLTWSTVLGSDIKIAAGEAVSLEVTNNEAGSSFEILYDSETYPSVIKLPTTTVIDIEDFAIYDAPYPGGSKISEFEADGTTAYLRATASDPFGSADITEIDFEVQSPGGGKTNYDGISVNSTGCERTFEYAWTIPTADGSYNISAFAKEGFEQTVIDTVKTTIVVNPPDPTAPCDLIFIDQDGNATPNFIINKIVCIRLEDSNTNKDDNVAESVVITLATNSGDSETLNLLETGKATGVFENCIPASTTSGASQNDGTLNAVENDIINVTHVVEEEDCSAFANVLEKPAQIKVLYFSDHGQGMDRIDPVATNDLTTSYSGALTTNGGTTNISVSADANLSDDLSDFSFGGFTNFQVGPYSGGTKEWHSVLKFDVSSLTPSDIGTVNLVIEMKSTHNVPITIEAYKLDTDWSESTVTWNSPWTTPGGDFGTTLYGSETVTSAFAIGDPSENLTIDITNLVREWVNGTSPNFGLLLKANDAIINSTINCNSKESGGGTDPYLQVITGNTQSFEMGEPFCQDFNILGGELITVETDVNILSGTMPANPNMTASLYTIDPMGNNNYLINIINPTYSGGKLTWAGGFLGGTIETIPIGNKLGFEISNNESAVNFEIAYDSKDFPSAVQLPTNTVIEIDYLDTHEGAYPSFTAVDDVISGDSIYILATVRDPFGSYDIRYMDLEITSPSGNETSVRLEDDDLTGGSGTCIKNYEYLWIAPDEEGEFSIKAIAQEGYETIQDSLITKIAVTKTDLGTSCVIEFLDNADMSRKTYDPDEQICLEITDYDKNVNSFAIETVQMTLESDAGDFETLTLTETGVNTGIFNYCISSSASIPGADEDNSIYAPSISIIYGEYIDSNDSTDICTQFVTINSLVPAVAISKTLTTPFDGNALPGETIVFEIHVSNPGPTELTTVFVGDIFDDACMTYQSASIAPDYSLGDSLNWANIGPIASGESQSIDVTFLAAAACNPARNIANTDAIDSGSTPVSAGPDTAEVIIANPDITVSKTIIAPLTANILVGDQVTYEIQITNTGNTTITTLPVFDSYSSFCQSFISASIAPDDNQGGSIVWNDMGPLAPSGMITFTVVLEAINPCSPAKNTVEIFYAVDQYGNAVPRVTDDAEIPVIVPPIAIDDYETTNENVAVVINVPDNDYDFNFDLDLTSVDMSGLQQPNDGTITSVNGTTGEITYTPNNNFIGNDTFVYQICDLTALCDTATVYIEIIEPPVEICGDGEDNDGDGVADCLDSDCSPVITSVTPSNPTCPAVDDGTITILATGNNLEYSIDNGTTYQTANTFTGLVAGNYDIIVQNSATGCQTVYAGNSITLSNPFCTEICNDGIDNDGDNLIDCLDPDCDDLTINITKDTTICDGDAKLLEVELVNCANACTAATTVTSFPYATSFENTFDNWAHMAGHDLDWRIHTGGTASSGTGPSGASVGTYYIYIEASGNNSGYPNKVAGIESPCFNLLDAGGSQLTFDYQMSGNGPGVLDLQITEDDGSNWTSIWSDSGSQGAAWVNSSVNLSSYVGKIVRIRFVGTTGTTWSGDIALDNLSLTVSDYTYAWNTSPVQTTPAITVSPTTTTTYTVTITDGLAQENIVSSTVTVKNCTEICNDGIDNDGDFLVDCLDGDCGQPTLANVLITHPVNCPDLDNGTIVITAGGVNLEYSIDNGATYQVSNTFSNLIPGSYNVVVQNTASGCSIDYSGNPFVLNTPTCPEICNDGIDNDGDMLTDCDDPDCAGTLSIIIVPNDDICEGAGGGIDLISSGDAPFTYVWDDMVPDARWDFDNSTDDVSGNGNDQHLGGSIGTLTYSDAAQEGIAAAYFDGTDYVRYSQDGGFMEVAFNNLTFSVWVKPDNLTGIKHIFDEGGATNGIGMRLNANLLEGAVRNGGTQFNAGSLVFPDDGLWHHVALVYKAGDFTIYLDGAPGSTISTAASYTTINAHSGNGGIGYQDGGDGFGSGGSGSYFIGYMDDARRFTQKALSGAQILDMARNDGDRTALENGTYSVTVTNGAYCKRSTTEMETISNIENVNDAGSIAADQTICSGDIPATFTSISAASGGAGGAISYQWQSSLNNSLWSDISGSTGLTYSAGALTQTTYYRRAAYRDGCSNQVYTNILTVEIVDNLTNPGAISGTEIQCGSYNPSTINSVTAASGGIGGMIEYQWQSSPNGSTGWADISGGITESFDPPVVASTTYFRRGARRNPCSIWDYTNTVLKTVVLNYTDGGTIGSDQIQCEVFDPTAITSSVAPSGGSGGSLTYSWEQNVNSGGWSAISGAIGATYDPPAITQTTEYRRGARRAPCTDFIYSNTVTKTLSSTSSAGISTFPTGNLCENTSYSFAAANAGVGATYSWNFGAYATPAMATGQGPHSVIFDVPLADFQTDFEVILNTSAGLCSGTDTVDVSVRPELIIANITGTNPTSCGATDGTLNFFVTVPTGADFEISIDGGGSFAAVNQTMFTGLTAGTYQVQLRYSGGDCPVDWGVVALEDPFLPTSAIFQDYTAECFGETLEFEALFNFFIGSYMWDFGAGATPATATGRGPHFVTYSSTGNKTVTLTVSGFGCSKDYNELFTLTENFTSGGSIASDQDLCGTFDPAELTASASPAGGGSGTADYQWESRIDDGSGDWDEWGEIIGATNETFDPTTISEPTQFRRKARNLPCTDWLFSNAVTVTPSGTPTAIGDTYSSVCPGNSFGEDLILNDVNIVDPEFSIHTAPTNGVLTIFEDGQFLYVPNSTFCGTDQFIYEVCNSGGVCCDTAIVNLNLTDTQAPMFTNIPADVTITCDEDIPGAPSVVAIENCLSVSVSLDEISTQGIDGCSINDYQITRIWTATDYCGNSTTDSQIITIEDTTSPDIYRIYTLPNGKKMVAGVTERVSENWKHITMPITFSTNPIIFTQIITDADQSGATVRLRNVSTSQFDIQLSTEEAASSLHGRESVAWIAIEEGVQSTGDPFEVGSLILTDAVSTQAFTQDFGSNPGLLASVQTRVETDPIVLRQTNLTGTGVNLNLQEEISNDAEVAHLDETVGYFVFENLGDFKLATGEIIGESGNISIDHNWTTITFSNSYTNPVVVANVPNANESSPVFTRIKDITSDNFKIKLQEWDYLDGIHALEELTWFVVEGSVPFDAEVPCEAVPVPLESETEIIAVDNCDLNISLSFTETLNTNSCAPNNQITRTWSATDDCGNSTIYTRIITVIDTIAPDFTVPADINITCLEDIDDLARTGDVTDETDNCAVGLEATYADIFNGTFNCDSAYLVQRDWTLVDGCGNSVTKTQLINIRFEGVYLEAKIMLQGAMHQNVGDGLMRDDLRQKGMIPLQEPYTELAEFEYVGDGGGETTSPNVFLTTGNDAIVDWVFIEIRDRNKPDSVVNTRAGLLQRDGDIVDVDGTSALAFNTLFGGSYHIAVRHRNHLGIMTDDLVLFTGLVSAVADFTLPTTECWGVGARRTGDYGMEMWGGDYSGDGAAIFQGSRNDVSSLFVEILTTDANVDNLLNFIYEDYNRHDFDLDGEVILQGPGNEKAKLLFQVIFGHPNNTFKLANFVASEQLP